MMVGVGVDVVVCVGIAIDGRVRREEIV